MSTSFDELLTKARTAPRPHKDVNVTLDRGVSQQSAEIRQQIEDLNTELAGLAGDKRMADPRPGEIEKQIEALDAQLGELTKDTLVTFRFTELPGQEWAEYRARCMPRLDVPMDRAYGFNYHDVAKLVAPQHGLRVLDDGTTETLTPEQWEGLWGVLSGHEFEKIASRIFELNEYDPEQRIAAAGKASRAGSDAKSN